MLSKNHKTIKKRGREEYNHNHFNLNKAIELKIVGMFMFTAFNV